MKRKLLCVMLIFVMLFSFWGCETISSNNGLNDEDYTRYSTDYDPNVNSWEQIDPTDEDVEITWFMDYAYSENYLSDLIYNRTGVKVKFIGAINSKHDELNTMIAGNKLPDVISVNDTSIRVQLAEEGYCYAINKLAESYAPSLFNHVPEEHFNYYKVSDGNTYNLASHFYNFDDMKEFKEMGGEQYSIWTVMVRKDWLNAYINYRKGLDSNFDPDKTITKPSGYLEMCKWVKNEYRIADTVPTVMFNPFYATAVSGKISESLEGLMDFLGVPREDANGNVVYTYGTDEFLKLCKFMNDLYNNKLFISTNFAYDDSQVGSYILNGKCFSYIGPDQTYRSQFLRREIQGYNPNTKELDPAYEYVSIMLTDEAGRAPLIGDYAGSGQYQVMITKNCKREDRVIKVLDYLMSPQGKMEAVYGGSTEGEYYNYTVRPGEIDPETNKVSKYGQVVTTQKFKEKVVTGFDTNLKISGIGRQTPLMDSMFQRIISRDDNFSGIVEPFYWTVYNNKKTYFGYTYWTKLFRIPLDVSDRRALMKYVDQQADIEAVWIEALPQIIMANSNTQAEQLWRQAVSLAASKGVDEWMAFRNKCFKKYKEELGVKYAWAKADPNYIEPAVTLFGNSDKYMSRPDWLYDMYCEMKGGA